MKNTIARNLTFKPPPTPREIINVLESIDNSQYLIRFNHLNNAAMRMQGRTGTDPCQQISFAKYYFLNHHSDVDLRTLGRIYENIMQDAYDYNYKEVIDKLDDLDKSVLLELFGIDFFKPVNNEAKIQDFNRKVVNYILGSLKNNYKLEYIISELLNTNPHLFPGVNKTDIDITINALTKNINWKTSVEDLYQQYLRAFMTDTIYDKLKKELLNPEGRIVTIPYPLVPNKLPMVVTDVNGKLRSRNYDMYGGKKRKTNKRKKKKSQTKKNKRRGKKKSKSRKNRR